MRDFEPDLLGSVVVDDFLVLVDRAVVVVTGCPMVSAFGWFVVFLGFCVIDWRVEIFLRVFRPVLR